MMLISYKLLSKGAFSRHVTPLSMHSCIRLPKPGQAQCLQARDCAVPEKPQPSKTFCVLSIDTRVSNLVLTC